MTLQIGERCQTCDRTAAAVILEAPRPLRDEQGLQEKRAIAELIDSRAGLVYEAVYPFRQSAICNLFRRPGGNQIWRTDEIESDGTVLQSDGGRPSSTAVRVERRLGDRCAAILPPASARRRSMQYAST